MADKPVVFISSTSDLRSARDLVGKVLYSMGYEPVWQDIAATEGGELLDVLRRRIEPCAVVLQLVGQRYGAEPPQPTPEFGRISYTQFEALYAERLGRKVVYHFVAPDFPVDPMPPEADELVQLQARYKEKIVAANRLRHEGIASPVDLELSIRRINDELASLRRQAERRARRTLWLIGVALAGVAAVAALVLLAIRQQGASEARHAAQAAALQEELAAMRSELLAAVAPKPLSPGQARPDALSPELMEKARLLSENGNAEDQVLAKISLDQHDEANRIIQQLKAGADKPGGDPFSLLTLEGDNWYRAGQFDKAVGPYEKALALRPTDVKARNNVVLAHSFARLGNIADHQRRAIEVAEGTLKLVAPGSREWALTQNNLGYAWSCLPTGDKSENLSKAIQCYGAALTVFSKTADPLDWAMTQNGLGNAWQDMPTGDKSENLRKAIDCLQAALGIFTKTAEPTRWAITESNLGDAWQFMPSGKKAENFRKAMACYTAALTVFTETEDPSHWAQVQNNLGFAWTYMPTGDKAANLRKAIDCFQAALRVRTQAADPAHWAQTQNNLGNAWHEMPTGDKAQNLHKAIAYYEAVLSVRTKTGDPIPWAETQKDLGNAWQDMPAGDKAENLGKAIACYEAALTVRSKSADPTRWADTQYDLGNAWYDMPAGDKAENLRKAIACYQAALSVYTKSADSSRWGTVQYYLGDAWCDLPAGDQAENLRQGIACYQAALTVRSRSADPTEWADTQNAIASALTKLADVKGQDRAALLVQAIADDKAALEVYTLADYPQEHEEFQQKLQALRKVYESSAGPKAKPFDKIPAAQ